MHTTLISAPELQALLASGVVATVLRTEALPNPPAEEH